MSAEEALNSPVELWSRVVREMKQGPVNVMLWRALEAARPLAIEENFLVVGLTTEDFHLGAHMTQGQARRDIQVLLSRFLGRECRLEIIQGEAVEDWAAEKVRRAGMAAAAPSSPTVQTKASDPWENLHAEMSQHYHSIPNKSQPWVMAEYLLWALQEIHRVREECERGLQDPPAIERELNRVLHRLASQTQLPSAQVGLEYLRAGKGS